MSMKKEVKQFLERAVKDGWVVEKTNGQHYQLKHPCGALVYCSSTPRDFHAIKNMEGDLKRALRQAEANGWRR